MEIQFKIDLMVNAAWEVIRNDFERQAVLQWKKRARECLVSLVGENHYYTEQFDIQTKELNEKKKIMACCGILSAAKEFAKTDTSNITSDLPADKAS